VTPDQYLKAKAVFLAACERPTAELADFLDAACGGDADVRREVESLLAFRDDTANTVQSEAQPRELVRLAGRYALGAVIGRGGMGRVYEAVDERFNRRVAVKELSIEGSVYANAFAHEARLLNGLRHPSLPVVIDLFDEQTKSYLIMDFVPGQNLKELTLQRLESGLGPWPHATVLRWADGLLDALEYLASFSPPIVHRDIKPHNLKLTPNDGIVLLDFGLAKGVASDATGEANSVPGFSLNYAPIEQLRGSGTDVRADLFALGATLVHLLAGVPPPDALTRADAILQGRTDPLDRFLDALPVPVAVIASLRHTLALSRSDRPQSAAALRALLRLAGDSNTEGRSAAETRRSLRPGGPSGPVSNADSTNFLSSATPSNLPQPLTGFLGREAETVKLIDIVRSSRVVTLTGPGGIGKTRLALRVAEELVDEHPGGVWFVDLSSLPDPALVAQTVATASGVTVSPEAPVPDALAAAFAARPTLLVLDNCEHVLDACAMLVNLLVRAGENLHVIATSRERLGIAGERVWPVMPLVVDDSGASDGESALESEAARLFVDRARRLRPTFEVTPGNTAAILELCRRLEGIPLAIELAAARVNVLSVEQILKLIDKRLSAYSSGDRTAPERQRTLGAAIDWSFNLLDVDERAMLCRLSLFPVGFGLEAVTAIAGKEVDALGLLARLVDKSLVNVDERRGEARYRLLETTRDFSAQALGVSGDGTEALRAFVAWARAFSSECVRELTGPNQAAWLERTGDEHDALLAALSLSLGEPSLRNDALELAASLAGYWQLRGYVREGRVWLERAAAASSGADERLRASALRTAAAFANMAGDIDRAENLYDEALSLARGIGDDELIGRTLTNLAITLRDRGRLDEATAAGAEAVALFRGLGHDQLLSIGLLNLGAVRLDAGSEDEAGALFAECIELKRRLGDRFGVANALANLASVHKRRSEWAEARRILTESLSLRRGFGEKRGLALTLVELATVEIGDGRPDAAAPLLSDGTALYEETGDQRGLVYAVEAHAQLAGARDDHELALILAAAAAAERERLGTPLLSVERAPVDAVVERGRRALGPEKAEAAERDGWAMTRDRMLELIRS
jgi:non-specific serine/threonine protein kinase